jgi:hypothetical protein
LYSAAQRRCDISLQSDDARRFACGRCGLIFCVVAGGEVLPDGVGSYG